MPQNVVAPIEGLRRRTLPSAIAACNPRAEPAFGSRGSQSATRGRTWNVLPFAELDTPPFVIG